MIERATMEIRLVLLWLEKSKRGGRGGGIVLVQPEHPGSKSMYKSFQNSLI
jgi:hypothetical protein